MQRLLVLATSLCVFVPILVAADPTGTWKAQVPTRPGRTVEMVIVLRADGEKLTGTTRVFNTEREISAGKVKGDEISFTEGDSSYTGKAADDEIQFTVQRAASEANRGRRMKSLFEENLTFTAKKAIGDELARLQTPKAGRPNEGPGPQTNTGGSRRSGSVLMPGDFLTIGRSELLTAVLKGDADGVRNSLSRGSNPNISDPKFGSALGMAALMGRSEIVKLLLGRGANPNARESDGGTPLAKAAGNGDVATIEALLAGGAKANGKGQNGGTALMVAARQGHTEAARVLLDHGTKVNARTGDGRTALTFALQNGRADVVRLLRSAGGKE